MSLNRERWQQLSSLFDEALSLAGPARAEWLAGWHRRDPALAGQLADLLGDCTDTNTLTGPMDAVRGFGRLLDHALAGDPAPAGPAAGTRLGPWELLHKIGEGGMGQVWLAQRADGLYDARAAIKLLRGDLSGVGLAARFARERAVLARLNHPAVARLLDAGVSGGQAYLVLEYVAGQSLSAHVREACPTVADRVRLLMRIGEAVDHAHAQLIVHRDLKPSNVMVTAEGDPKLLDFGIAGLLDESEGRSDGDLTRLTGRGLTLGYAAPEQIQGAPIGTASDVFSLGVLLYEMLSGELPFAPRDAPRLAMERAVLHDEPRRLSQVLQRAPHLVAGPGRPADAARARGDLEAVLAKALRKNPAERYGSVRALLDDLNRWLEHRPVSARADDWRHRSRLFLRRHALPAVALTLVLLSLSGGLAVALWQSNRAHQAARQSERIADYLTELLASASPDRHGGKWPTVLQLLESSRQALPQKFLDDPQTRLRLLAVLSDTYHQLNRFDIAMPLQEEQVALATQLHGSDGAETLRARLDQARTFQVQGLFDKVIVALEALREPLRRELGPDSEEHRQLLYILSTSYTRTGRLDDADRMLAEVGRITEARFPPGSPERLSHLNHLQVLRVGQGRLREALEAIRATQPYWNDPDPERARQILVFRRNTLAVQIRLAQYERIEERSRELLADMDRLLGPGNDMAMGLRVELARYFTEIGDFRRALQQRQDNLALADAAGVQHPAVRLPLRVALALARTQAGAADAGTLRREARALLAEVDAAAAPLGYARAEAWISLARIGLALDDDGLAADAVARLVGDAGLRLDRDALLASRVAQLEGGLARLQGDLPRSRQRLLERQRLFERPLADRQTLPAWAAALDLAYTEVLAGGRDAAAALDTAAARRPPGMPPGHPLDAVTVYLRARLHAGSDSAPAVQQALRAVLEPAAARGGPSAGTGRGSLGAALTL